jgi:hypothetical protein
VRWNQELVPCRLAPPRYAARAIQPVRGRHPLRCLRVAGFAPLLVILALPQPRSLDRQRHELLLHP